MATTKQSCPFLGLRNDPDSFDAYASQDNLCFKKKPSFMVRMEHQQTYCLTEHFQICPVFLAQGMNRVSPDLIEPDRILSERIRRVVIWSLVIMLIAIAVGMALFFQDNLRKWLRPLQTRQLPAPSYAAPAVFSSPQPTDPYQPGMISQPAFLANPRTPEPSPSDTAVPDANYPLGSSGNLVIHEILAGESLDYLANKYLTTVDAIRDINPQMKVPLWTGEMIVIPQDINDTSLLPVFETIYLSELMPLQSITKEYNIDVKLLKRYNSRIIITRQNQEIILGEQWVLLPRPR